MPLPRTLFLLLLFVVYLLRWPDNEVSDGDCSDHQNDQFVLFVKLLGFLDVGIEPFSDGRNDGFDAIDDRGGECLEEAGEL